jgi:hypothetical protein
VDKEILGFENFPIPMYLPLYSIITFTILLFLMVLTTTVLAVSFQRKGQRWLGLGVGPLVGISIFLLGVIALLVPIMKWEERTFLAKSVSAEFLRNLPSGCQLVRFETSDGRHLSVNINPTTGDTVFGTKIPTHLKY